MKKLIAILFVLFYLSGSAQVARDFQAVITFSAPGDGVTDVSAQWNTAVNYCYSHNKKLFIPAGTYNLAGAGDLAAITTGAGSINWEGEGDGSIILVPGKAARVLNVSNADVSRIFIRNIHFKSTHDTTNIGNNCLLLQGINGHIIHNVTLTGVTIEGFTESFTGRGVVDVDIFNCIFLAPAGHDNATTLTTPAVFIHAVDNNVADLNRNWKIHDNTLDGYSGTGAITATKQGGPMDNGFYGHVSGLQFYDNTLRNFAQELILLQPQLAVIDSAMSNIYGNHLKCYLPFGSAVAGTKLRSNYGIRADGQHVRVFNNDIMGATSGIWCDATLFNYQYRDLTITGNYIGFAKDTAMRPSYGIYVRGYSSGLPMKNVKITGNTFNQDSIFLQNTCKNVAVTYVDSPTISGNSTSAVRITKNGFGVQHIYLNTCIGVLLGDNPQVGVDTALYAPSSTYTSPLTLTAATYTPVLTNSTNVASSSLSGLSTYTRVGNVVSVKVEGSIRATAANTGTILIVTLPVSVTTADEGDVGVTMLNDQIAGGSVMGETTIATGTTFEIICKPTTTNVHNFTAVIQYFIH